MFSHVDIPEGKFAQSRAVRDIPGSKLFLNCLDNKWYTNGIHDFSTDIPSTISNVVKLIEGYEAVFIGHSMGAYMSLICGNMMERSKFVSTSPELMLGLDCSRTARNNVPKKPKWWNVEELKPKFHEAPDGVTLFGAYDPIDCYFLSEPERLNGIGRVFEVPHHHGVTEYMTSYKIYEQFLNGVFDGKRDESAFTDREHFASVGTYGSPEQYRHFYDTFCVFMNDRSDSVTLREKASKFADWTNPGWQELRAKIHYASGDFANALTAANSAYRFQPDLMQFIETYGNVCLRMKDRGRLVELVDGLSPAQRNHRTGKRMIEKVHRAFGQLYRLQLDPSDLAIEEIESNDGNPEQFTDSEDIPPLDVAAYPYSEYKHTPPAEELPATSLFHAALTSRDHDFILSGTRKVEDNTYADRADALMCRALSLVVDGDKSASLRTLRAVLDDAKVGRRAARICLDVGLKTRSVALIEYYLNMSLDDRTRKFHANRLARALVFVTAPNTVSAIVVELLKYGSDLDRRLATLRIRCRKYGTGTVIVQNVIAQISDVDITKENLESLAAFLTESGFRDTALNLLADDGTFLEDPRDPDAKNVRGNIAKLLPVRADFVPSKQ